MRDIIDLENNALKFWPSDLADKEKDSSIIPKLIETQDKFISLLNISDATPFSWKDTLTSSKSLSGNLFLKHLRKEILYNLKYKVRDYLFSIEFTKLHLQYISRKEMLPLTQIIGKFMMINCKQKL